MKKTITDYKDSGLRENAMKSILSIDGGGIRGIIYLKLLEYMESQTGKQIHELFDVIELHIKIPAARKRAPFYLS